MSSYVVRTFHVFIFLIALTPWRVWSLDLYSIYPRNSITGQGDFYTLEGHSLLTVSAMYSWMHYVNPVAAMAVPFGGDGLSTSGWVGNLMEVYKRQVDCYLFPYVKVGGEETQIGVSVEVSKEYNPLTPYLRLTGEDKSSPLWNIGASYILWKGAEVLVEVTPGGERGSSVFAAGFNYLLMRDLELVGDIANDSKTTMIHAGAIWNYQL